MPRPTFRFRYVIRLTTNLTFGTHVSYFAYDSRELTLDIVEEIAGMGWGWQVTTVARAA